MATPLLLNRGGVLRRGFIKGSDLALIPSSTPPNNPSAGDLWLYSTGVQGAMWMFVYDTTEATAYKWKFIGGAPIWTHYDYSGGLSIGNSTYTAITNLAITAPFAGDYIFTADALMETGQVAAKEVILALSVNSTTAIPAAGLGGEGEPYFAFPSTNSAGNPIMPHGMVCYEKANAGDVFRVLAWCAATGTNSIAMARFHCTPIRVAA